jgi:hypothetical protein
MLAFALAAVVCWLIPASGRAAPPEQEKSEAADVTLERADDHRARARFPDAATDYERFATSHPDDERAAGALENAYLLRVGLGEREQAEADRAALERSYLRTQPERAAEVFWSRRAQLERNQARRDHAVAYLKSYRHGGGVDREIVAEAVIAQIDWRRSCDEPMLLDSCVVRQVRHVIYDSGPPQLRSKKTPARAPALPTHCRAFDRMYTQISSRDLELANAAQKRLAKLLARVGEVGELPIDDPKRAREFADAWGMALVYRTDATAEALLRTTKLPSGLELVPADWTDLSQTQLRRRARSRLRLEQFLSSITVATDEIVREYASVEATGSAHWTQAAALRKAELYESLADVIQHSETSDAITTREQHHGQCMLLANEATPLRARALAAYVDCFEQAVASRVETEFMHACAERLSELDRHHYPLDAEFVGTPTVSSSVITQLGVVGPV